MESDEICARANDAIANLIGEVDPGAMATRFVVAIEVLGSDGERGLWLACAPDQKAWDTLGLLEYAKSCEQSSITRGYIQGDD